MKSKKTKSLLITSFALLSIFITSTIAQNQSKQVSVSGNEVTVLVTAHPHNDQTRANADKLQSEDFSVREDKRSQQIVAVKKASDVPTIFAVIIQDDLISRVSNEIKGIKNFVRRLPEGSQVMTGYLTVGDLTITQDFTEDRERAAHSLRIVRGSQSAAPFNPYLGVIAALRKFESQPVGRRVMLLVSDGLDTSRGLRSASPALSVDLDRAIREAQRRGVIVYTMYAPSVGLTSVNQLAISYGQGSLNRIADETGGEAFFSGTTFVSFDSFFKKINERMGRQWLVTYRSSNTDKDFRRIEVSTEVDIHLHYAAGYYPRDKN